MTATGLLAPPSRPRAERPAPPRQAGIAALDVALLALIAATAAALAAGAPPAARVLVTFSAAILVPGYALISHLRVRGTLLRLGLAVGLSLAVDVLAALAMTWLPFWHPTAMALAVGAASALLLLASCLRCAAGSPLAEGRRLLRRSRPWPSLPSGHRLAELLPVLAVLIAGTALWAISLGPISARAVTADGLQTVFGPAWFVALALFAAAAVVELARARPRAGVVVVLVIAVVAVLYATVPAISHAPQYTWSYKHIGVARSIMEHRPSFGSGDIYHRWPGLFSASAWFATVTHTAPLYFAAWFEFAFTLLDVLLVAAIAYSTFGDARITGFSALLFAALNWIGQDYFSPQGLGYTLNLTVMLVIVTAFPLAGTPASRLLSRVARLIRSPLGRDEATETARPAGWSTSGAALAILVLDAAATATHQLTPFMILVQLAALTLLGLRPRWLLAITAILAIGYTVPELPFLARTYGIFKGLNPIDNVQQATGAQVHPGWLEAHAGQLLTLCGAILAIAGLARLRRQGETRLAVRLAALTVAPFFLLFANSYGGEGGLRVVLFAAPWMSLLGAVSLSGVRRPLRLGAGMVAMAGMLALFLFAFSAYRTGNVIPAGEVAASEHYYAAAPPGSVMVLAGQDFPTNEAPNYAQFRGSLGDSTPDLLDFARFRRPTVGGGELPALIGVIEGFAKGHPGGWVDHGYLAFSTTQTKYTSYFRVAAPSVLPDLEREVATSPRFRLWYANGSARIYKLVVTPAGRRSRRR